MFDVLILIIILWTLWTFVPRTLREAIGMGASSALRDAWRFLGSALRAAEPVIHQLIVGKPRPQIEPKTLYATPLRAVDRTVETPADEQTDRQTDRVSGALLMRTTLEVDRTKKGAVKALLIAGWNTGQIREVIKGDNNSFALIIEEARRELGSPAAGVEYPSDREARINREIAETQAA